jgi:hypothetical protein
MTNVLLAIIAILLYRINEKIKDNPTRLIKRGNEWDV